VDVSASNVTNPANVAVMKALGTTPGTPATSDVPAGAQVEWLALPDGTVRRVVTVGSELLPPDAAARAVAPKCACGEPRRARAQSCGAAECVERLWASMKS
jgi:hypothetical protein